MNKLFNPAQRIYTRVPQRLVAVRGLQLALKQMRYCDIHRGLCSLPWTTTLITCHIQLSWWVSFEDALA